MAQMPVFNDFTARQGEIARRRKMAEMLQLEGMKPLEQQTAGGMVVPISPVQGLAKMLQTYIGTKGLENAAAQDQAIASEKSQALAQALGAMPQATTSTETKNVAPWLPNDDEGNVNPSVPVETKVTTKPTAQQYATWLAGLGNIGQDAVQIGSGVMNFKQKEDEAEANRQQRMQELQLRLLDSRQTAQERMDLQRQLAEMQQSTQRTIAEGNQQTRLDAIQLTAGLRQPPTPPAPSMATIVDPRNPSQMITVDTRQYVPGGTAGIIGVSGKEPTALKREEQGKTGREQVSGLVTTLRDYYNQLDEGGGITNPDAGVVSNMGRWVARSPVGQVGGSIVGTRNQTARDAIAQTRPLLLNAIKNATGMSAKQMDSNAELKMYLAAATDPTLSVKANRDALDQLERLYGLDGGAAGASGGWSIKEKPNGR